MANDAHSMKLTVAILAAFDTLFFLARVSRQMDVINSLQIKIQFAEKLCTRILMLALPSKCKG